MDIQRFVMDEVGGNAIAFERKGTRWPVVLSGADAEGKPFEVDLGVLSENPDQVEPAARIVMETLERTKARTDIDLRDAENILRLFT